MKWWEIILAFAWTFGGCALFFGSIWTAVNGPAWAGITAVVGWFAVSLLGQSQIAIYKRAHMNSGDAGRPPQKEPE